MNAAVLSSELEPGRSLWDIHRAHIVMLVAWLVVVAAVLIGAKLRERRAGAVVARARMVLPRNGWVFAAGAATVLSAAIHLDVIGEHFEESALYGAFFLVLTIVQFGWTAWLLARPSMPLLLAGAGGSLGVALLWLATRTISIPVGPAAGEKEAVGSIDVVASAAEVLVAVFAIGAIWAVAGWGRGYLRRAGAAA